GRWRRGCVSSLTPSHDNDFPDREFERIPFLRRGQTQSDVLACSSIGDRTRSRTVLGIRCVLGAVSAAFGREPVWIAALKLVEVPHCHVAEADAEGRGEPSDVPEYVPELTQ